MANVAAASVNVPVRDGFPSFTDSEIARRHAALRNLMTREGIDGLLAYGAGRFNAEMQYLTNWPGGREGFVLLPLDGEPALRVQFFNHVPLARRLSLVADTAWAGSDAMKTLAGALMERDLTSGRIGLVGPWTVADRDRLTIMLPATELVPFAGPYRQLRAQRSDEELGFLRYAAHLTDDSIRSLEAELRPGLREYELPAILEPVYLRAGGYAGIHFMSSTPMAAPETCVPHQYQSDRVIQTGDVVITEISGAFWGYASQIHRTYVVGAKPLREWRDLHNIAVETFDAVSGVLREGATVADVLDAAEIINRRGYTILDDLLHGLDQYPPIVRTRSTDHGNLPDFRFAENMVVTIQPHVVTRDQRMGLQFGETVRITRGGVEFLHDYPRDLIVVDG